ncbi:hypothetical protein [Myroides sp. N17-2]|uniref:hypothetical protein n=1 Tax=Myroides sp. N17-2 TaxID=2030799 RepID=UPI000EFD491C|nr:hypothetical protein [Myroides sp. N17-2]
MKINYLLLILSVVFISCKNEQNNSLSTSSEVTIIKEENFNKESFKDRAEELIYIRDYLEYKLPILIMKHSPDLVEKVQQELIFRGENSTLEEAAKRTKNYQIAFESIINQVRINKHSFREVKNVLVNDYFKQDKKNIKIQEVTIERSNNETVGNKIYGDFNGDGKFEYAYRKLTKKGYGNPVENGVPDEYEIHFSDNSINPIKVGCCWFKLINEGDLNNDRADEITIVQSPENGCIGRVSTYTIKNNKSNYLFEPFSIFVCAEISNNELEKLIVKENNTIFYFEADPNDENQLNDDGTKIRFERLIKKQAVLF